MGSEYVLPFLCRDTRNLATLRPFHSKCCIIDPLAVTRKTFVPSPISVSLRGEGKTPPSRDIGNRFHCRCQGGNFPPLGPVDGSGGELSPPWRRHRKPFSLSLPGGVSSPPPGDIGIGEGTGVRKPFSLPLPGRGDRRSETVFVAPARERGQAFANRFRCLCREMGVSPPPRSHWNRRGDRCSETVFVVIAGERGQAFGNHFRFRCNSKRPLQVNYVRELGHVSKAGAGLDLRGVAIFF